MCFFFFKHRIGPAIPVFARNQLAEIIKIHLSLGIIDRSRNTKDIFVFDFQYLKFLFFLKDRVFNNFLENDLKRVIY